MGHRLSIEGVTKEYFTVIMSKNGSISEGDVEMSRHEKEREQEDTYTKTECHYRASAHALVPIPIFCLIFYLLMQRFE